MPLAPFPASSKAFSICPCDCTDWNVPPNILSKTEMGVALPGNALAGLPASVASVAIAQLTQFVVLPAAGNPGFTLRIDPANSSARATLAAALSSAKPTTAPTIATPIIALLSPGVLDSNRCVRPNLKSVNGEIRVSTTELTVLEAS